MSRYPYTYAADLVRSIAGPQLSRGDASAIWRKISDVFGIDERDAAETLANYYLDNETSITEAALRRVIGAAREGGVDRAAHSR